MKTRIESLSIHQNAKIFAILIALSSLVFVLPFMVFFSLSAPEEAAPPLYMAIVFPVFYLVFGYLMTAIGCWVYNWIARHTGGLEFESRNVDASV
ncbi:MAG: hypothetical protein O9318_14455 [Hylemonella sp.]|uniref:hypothetical protein n=1 Tax=Hylemonella sp. TaxID=2066020 RepID=UPI0022C6B035|nr:hypothetical protein [Hylemonella sp.]MCZ8253667.1 hypothetical protein [Hylemonella sp.]